MTDDSTQAAVRPIQTEYRGHLFRSRLEARWAVFFDALGVEWRYEPEGYETPHGRYLPDFWLPSIGLLVDVKPMCGWPDRRLEAVASHLNARATILGPIPDPERLRGLAYAHCQEQSVWCDIGDAWDLWEMEWTSPVAFPDGGGDEGPYAWCACTACDAVGFEFEGRVCRSRTHDAGCVVKANSNKRPRTPAHPRILSAYRAARSARFEHGQIGRML